MFKGQNNNNKKMPYGKNTKKNAKKAKGQKCQYL